MKKHSSDNIYQRFVDKRLIYKLSVIALLMVLPVAALTNYFGNDYRSTVLNVSAIYCIIFLILRMLGKREFSQLSLIELISLILIPDLVSQGVVGDNTTFLNSLVAVTTLFSLVAITSMIISSSSFLERLMVGQPTILVENGQFNETNMEEENVTDEEVEAATRKQGVRDLSDVDIAVLETDGTISVVPKDHKGVHKKAKRKL